MVAPPPEGEQPHNMPHVIVMQEDDATAGCALKAQSSSSRSADTHRKASCGSAVTAHDRYPVPEALRAARHDKLTNAETPSSRSTC